MNPWNDLVGEIFPEANEEERFELLCSVTAFPAASEPTVREQLGNARAGGDGTVRGALRWALEQTDAFMHTRALPAAGAAARRPSPKPL